MNLEGKWGTTSKTDLLMYFRGQRRHGVMPQLSERDLHGAIAQETGCLEADRTCESSFSRLHLRNGMTLGNWTNSSSSCAKERGDQIPLLTFLRIHRNTPKTYSTSLAHGAIDSCHSKFLQTLSYLGNGVAVWHSGLVSGQERRGSTHRHSRGSDRRMRLPHQTLLWK